MPFAADLVPLFFFILWRDWRQKYSVKEVSLGTEKVRKQWDHLPLHILYVKWLSVLVSLADYQRLQQTVCFRHKESQLGCPIRQSLSSVLLSHLFSPSRKGRLEEAKLVPLWQSLEEGIQIPRGGFLLLLQCCQPGACTELCEPGWKYCVKQLCMLQWVKL